MKKIFYIQLIAIGICLLSVSVASAAGFYLEPGSGNLIKGCTASVRVKMHTAGATSNGAQVYVTHTGSASLGVSGAGLFSAYGTPPDMPSGWVGLYGYGGNVSGDDLNFATISVTPNALGSLGLNIVNTTDEMTSKIANYPTSENILTEVGAASFTVIDGYCETVPPYMTNMNPPAGKPNHPVAQNITFDLHDDGSGLDMSTFSAIVMQNSVALPTVITETANGTGDKSYSIVIDPVNNLTPELKVEVTVSVSDKAGNNMTRVYYFNDLTCAALGCAASAITAQCNDGVDNDSDGLIDYPSDTGCESLTDNNEWLTTDFVCATGTVIIGGGTAECAHASTTPQCDDGVDNDSDGLMDMADPGCASSTDNNEFAFGDFVCPVTATTTCETAGGTTNVYFSSADIRVYLAGRTIETGMDQSGDVQVLAGSPFTVAADTSGIPEQISSLSLQIGDKAYRLYYDDGLKLYAADISDLTQAGGMSAAITVKYGVDKQVVVPFSLSVLPRGKVTGKVQSGATSPLVGVTVELQQLAADNNYVTVVTANSDENGTFGFVVPNGAYRLSFNADGYRTMTTAGFHISDRVVNRSVNLITAVNLLDASVSVSEKASYVAEVAAEGAQKIIDSRNDPVVQKAAETKVAPIALAAAAVAVIPAILSNLISYLRYIFFQPVFLLGYRRRKKWGVVYNSLTKMPIDLAVMRLIDVKTGHIVQSRVTDSEGRYAFFVEPGLYRIEVTKNGFVFPTKILQDYKEDTGYLDLYHGEPVHVDEKYAAIAANIPLDPVGVEDKTPRRIFVDKWMREIQRFIASLSIAIGLIATIIEPSILTIGLLVLQILLYILFRRLAMPRKPKNWGIVYDRADKKPINRAVTRLFSKQFNKLIATEITDNNGRYSFMVGPNEYYITFEKSGYKKVTSQDLKIKDKNELVKLDVAMNKENNAVPQAPTSSENKPTATVPVPQSEKPPETSATLPPDKPDEPKIQL